MDFNSLGTGSSFYIHTKREGQEPTLAIGGVKEKVLQQPQYQLHTVPNALNGMGGQQLFRFTVNVNGSDRVIPDLPANVEIASKGDETYTGNPQAMMQVVDSMMKTAKDELGRESYNNMILKVGEKQMELLNPRYAEEKQRDRTIKELVDHRKETDSKLDKILAFMQELTSPTKKQNP